MNAHPEPLELVQRDYRQHKPAWPDNKSIKIVQWNIERGYKLPGIIDELRRLDADIVALQEVDIGCERSGSLDTGDEIARALGLNYLFLTEFVELHSPLRTRETQGGGVHGNALLSRFDMLDVRVIPHSKSSPIEGILDKGSYTLEELLDEDDLIQECKSLNARLIHYFKQPATVEALLRYIVELPEAERDDDDGDTDPKRQFKYPYGACEVFCCEVDAIFSTLVEDERLMDKLFSLLDAPRPLNCMLAGYFSRVLNALLLRKTAETMTYLQDRHEQLLPKLLGHIDTTSIGEALVRLVGADEQTRVFLHASSLQWLLDTPVLQMLLDMLGPDRMPAMQKAAADVLGAVAETQLSPLSKDLAKPEVMDTLFDRAFAVDGSALVPALNVCIALLEPRASARDAVSPTAAGEFLTPQLEMKMKTEAVFALAGKVGRLVTFLDEPPTTVGGAAPGPHDTPNGSLAPPLGSARLKVVELLGALARSGMKPAEAALVEGRAVSRCMELFGLYPFNNILHKHVAGMLATLLDAGSDETVAALLGQPVGVPAWLASLPETHGPSSGDGAPTRCTKPWRAGYMGHVTQLGSLIAGLAAKKPAVTDALAAEPAWAKFVEGYLMPQTARESSDAWACGRPNSMDIGGIDSEPDEFDGELDLEPMPGQQQQLAQGSRRDLCGVPDYRYAAAASGASDTQDDEHGNSSDDAGASSSDDDDDDADSFGAFTSAPPTGPVAVPYEYDAEERFGSWTNPNPPKAAVVPRPPAAAANDIDADFKAPAEDAVPTPLPPVADTAGDGDPESAPASSGSSVDDDDVVLTAEPGAGPSSSDSAAAADSTAADGQEGASDDAPSDEAASSQEFGFKFWRQQQNVGVSADSSS